LIQAGYGVNAGPYGEFYGNYTSKEKAKKITFAFI
jgi:hypothetical protein